jgi:hypothetical protein
MRVPAGRQTLHSLRSCAFAPLLQALRSLERTPAV